MKRGVYFLANDDVLKWARTFLCSFRTYNPDLPLCLIPYDRSVRRLMTLADRYKFVVFNDQNVFEKCAAIAEPFHPDHSTGHYRKFACWEGPFQEFVYIDVDTVVLGEVGFAFDVLEDYDILTAVSDLPSSRQWVWKPSVESANALDARQIAYAANTGFIVSRKEALPISYALRRLEDAAALAQHMVLHCIEQPVLNYFFVTSRQRITSLRALGPHMPQEWNASDAGGITRGGKLDIAGWVPLFVHWTGEWEPSKLHHLAHKLMKTARFLAPGSEPVKIRMPYRQLWQHYYRRS